ncbi:glycerol dehydrogenase [Leptogranulimonas caecicola]|jgi:glycerol dehydrogenase|uniref:Glycerol dehydrogenase n=1 Tax=Muricaecibacterium torontonense TaxID=3032871 RepID=A0A4S2F386_9ACTN|nr:glycerol dehydrogenase [Muricaecibacterium torontonense]MCI8676337.1 glycerol dehydrogenase [Atopobiaceae bacterium]TGY61664.1 glycerol dehydrogenase [Muricaecibacterium torontonense]BCV18601.1 glycerol dehydrogenase [Atopobiaceae bacterium P1]
MYKAMRAPSMYAQSPDCLNDFYDICKGYGKRFLFICSHSGLAAAEPKITKSCDGTDSYLRFEQFGGISSEGEITKMGQIVVDDDIDVVCGIGGGSAIDTAKATAFYQGKPVVIIPTVAATDAPCTGLSVIYHDDGSFAEYLFYPKNPDVVIVDSTIIMDAPVKFLVAGMGDALGTYYEARACQRTKSLSLENTEVTLSAMALCTLCRDTLIKDGFRAKVAAEKGVMVPALESCIEANIYLSGVGADNAGLCVAHSVYNGTTALEECESIPHGNIVAFGTLVQLVLEDAPDEELAEVMEFMDAVDLPLTLEAINITDPSHVAIAAQKACVPGESIHNFAGDVTPEQLTAAMFQADALGHAFLED